jgi:hypothetical protein
MNYEKHYTLLIERARNRILEGYQERHHIVPRCMGGSDDAENIVSLTAEEHYVAHQLLVKMYPTNKGLIFAAHRMSSGKYRNNKLYCWIRTRHAHAISQMNTGKILTSQHKAKISKSLIGKNLGSKNGMFGVSKKGIPLSEEHRQKITSINREQRLNKSFSEFYGEYRAKKIKDKMASSQSARLLGKPQVQVVCPQCGVSGGAQVMRRWHFDKCKNLKRNEQ